MNSSIKIARIRGIQSALQVLGALQLTAHLWPNQAHVKNEDSFDYIIVGAGSAGSVIANRLTELPEVNVLLIEAGGDPPFESEVPSLFPYLKGSRVDWNYMSVNDHYSNQFHIDGNQRVTRGKMLGGSSSINYMGYMRGSFHDYDSWAEMTNDVTWSWDNVLPYFKKSERQEDPGTLNSPYKIYHGTEGLLGVSKSKSDQTRIYLEAFAELGHKLSEDVSGKNPLGYMKIFLTISNNTRQSTARCFLSTVKERSNLYVLKQTVVKEILFDVNLNAIGVKISTGNNNTLKLYAERELIVSAGAIGSPQLLMASGIGPADHLKSKGIQVKINLPVGRALQDHVMALTILALGKSNPNPEPIQLGEMPGNIFEGYAALEKRLQVPQYQTLNFIFNDNSAILDLCAFYIEFKPELCDELFNKTVGRQIMFSFVVMLHPKSRGTINLKTKDIHDDPEIITGYYTVDSDLDTHAEFVKDFLKITGTEYFKSVNSEFIVPEICGCSRFEYGRDDFWRCYVLCMGSSGYHYSGSCPIGGVVDSRLKVYGAQKLRVVDASVMPRIPGCNTNTPTIMIAEKAADFVKDDYYSIFL